MSCPDCFTGHILTRYEPKGTIESIHGRQTYISRPEDGVRPVGIVIIISDAFGWSFPNTKHLADKYAQDGKLLVYLPDFMDGQNAPFWLLEVLPKMLDTSSLVSWIVKPWYIAQGLYGIAPFKRDNSFDKSMPKVTSFFTAVREHEAHDMDLSIGCAGFCWGGQHTFALASGEYRTTKGQPLCDAHFTAHPSNLKVPHDALSVKLPLSLAAASEDRVLKKAQAEQVEAILRHKASDAGLKHSSVVYYQGAGHGFGVRADPGNADVLKHADASVKHAISFFTEVFRAV